MSAVSPAIKSGISLTSVIYRPSTPCIVWYHIVVYSFVVTYFFTELQYAQHICLPTHLTYWSAFTYYDPCISLLTSSINDSTLPPLARMTTASLLRAPVNSLILIRLDNPVNNPLANLHASPHCNQRGSLLDFLPHRWWPRYPTLPVLWYTSNNHLTDILYWFIFLHRYCTSASQPSRQPTQQPSIQPSSQPTRQPSGSINKTLDCLLLSTCSCNQTDWHSFPVIFGSTLPEQPSQQPTKQPVARPSQQPTRQPTSSPSMQPSMKPSRQPSTQPSSRPSRPTNPPTRQPSAQPTVHPTGQPTSQPSSTRTFRPITTGTYRNAIALSVTQTVTGVTYASLLVSAQLIVYADASHNPPCCL